MKQDEHYLGNPLLKKANQPIEWTEEQVLEYQKCMSDPNYFISNYIKVDILPLYSLSKGFCLPFGFTNIRTVALI